MYHNFQNLRNISKWQIFDKLNQTTLHNYRCLEFDKLAA